MPATDSFLARVVEIRPMTEAEIDAEGWDTQATITILVFDNGAKLYPSQDDEGNGPGTFFGIKPDGKAVHVFASPSIRRTA